MSPAFEKAAVLAVDDRDGTLLAIEAALSGLDVELVLARNGREALRSVLARDFAVILLDVHMPDLDGFETAALIRQRRTSSRTPIIFMSADPSELSQEKSYSLGAVDFLTVPIIASVLRSKVSVFVDLHYKTEQVRRQAENLRTRTIQLQKLTTASIAINAATDLPAILAATARAAREIVGAHQAYVHVQARRTGEFQGAASYSERHAHLAAVPVEAERTGLFELTLARRAPVRLTTSELAMSSEWLSRQQGRRPARKGYLGVPLTRTDGTPLGVLELSERNEGEFVEDDAAVVVQLAQVGAIAIQNLLNAEAREANRLKDEFLAVVSHELRTPLSAILGWTHVLRIDPSGPQVAHAVDVIERNARLQARLIDDLMDVSRILHGRLELRPVTVSLRPLAEMAVQALRPAAAAKGVTVGFDADASDSSVVADPERLEQVISNLVTNAVKFTPAGGRVDVELRQRAGRVELAVSDTGEGLGSELLPMVFDRFRQGESGRARRRGGLGLGLTIVRHIVEAHGGSVAARSPGPGLGSTFSIELPLAERPVMPLVPMAVATAATPQELDGVRVLLIEDDPDTRGLLEHLLRERGAAVDAHPSAEEALEAFAAERPGVIISDIGLPGMDGVEFLRRVAELCGDSGMVPSLALTASGSDEDRRRALEAGFAQYACKPFDPEAVVRTVGRLATAAAAYA